MNPALERLAAVSVWAASAAPLWAWWMQRLAEPLGVDLAAWAILGVLILSAWFRAPAEAYRPAVWKIAAAAAGLAAFHFSRAALPPTVCGIFCVAAGVPLLLPDICGKDGAKAPGVAPYIALALTGLPSAMIMDLFLGIPLRVLATGAAALVLDAAGFPVEQRGLELVVADASVWVDVPCAGIRMLSSGMLAAFVFAALYSFRWGRTVLLALLALYAVVAVNVLRVAALALFVVFGHELSSAAHSFVGCALLLPAIVFVAGAAHFLGRWRA